MTAVLAGNDPFLTENISEDRKRFITQSKHILIKKKHFLKADDLFLLFLPKKFFFILGVVHNDTFSMQIGSKNTIFKRFYQLFFRTAGFQQVININCVSSNIFHWKSAVKESKVGVVFGQNLGQIGDFGVLSPFWIFHLDSLR